MRIIIFVLQCIFAINTGLVSLPAWDGKVIGVNPIAHLNRLRRGVYSVIKKNYGRLCIATAVSKTLLVSSAHLIKKYDEYIYNQELFVKVGNRKVFIEYIKYHDKYNASKQREFDIAIIKIMNFTLRSWLAVSVDVCTCISNEDTLELVGYVAKRNGPCILKVERVEFRLAITEKMRQDDPLFITMVNETNVILEDSDIGAPVLKDNKLLMGIVSYYFKTFEKTIIVCTSLLQLQVWDFIETALEEDERSSKRMKI